MKTVTQLHIDSLRAEMRAHALTFRETIHPDEFRHGRRFSALVERAAFYLRMACDYRDIARRAGL